MDLDFSTEQEAWRGQIESWIDEEFGADWVGMDFDEADEYYEFAQGIRTKLAAKGWSAPAWPAEHGGMGLGFTEQAIFNETL
ncbi:MAG TPA: acyl-CoA dehydrogenase family protein, partial [Dehalococcoidia bacterium]|nr:acyl-CoA dehydrogenase family protein [Dehalococcoidia bacterium]